MVAHIYIGQSLLSASCHYTWLWLSIYESSHIKICKSEIELLYFFQRYLVRRQMIESGMLEWLIDHLKQFLCQNANNISTYGLEYSTALFMNLCLHRSGKLRCLPMAQKVLSTFLQLLSSTNKRKVCINPKDTIKIHVAFTHN